MTPPRPKPTPQATPSSPRASPKAAVEGDRRPPPDPHPPAAGSHAKKKTPGASRARTAAAAASPTPKKKKARPGTPAATPTTSPKKKKKKTPRHAGTADVAAHILLARLLSDAAFQQAYAVAPGAPVATGAVSGALTRWEDAPRFAHPGGDGDGGDAGWTARRIKNAIKAVIPGGPLVDWVGADPPHHIALTPRGRLQSLQ